jgi:uncharacterized Zn finger protein (UPF0148 family)
MSDPICPVCGANEVLYHPGRIECITCGHEWVEKSKAKAPKAERVAKKTLERMPANRDESEKGQVIN